MAILFSNATVLPMTAAGNAPRTFAGWVGVDGNRIALVTESETAAAEFRAAHPGLREFDCRGKLVMPGLVNTHCHAAMTLQRSLADDIALMEWLHDYIWPFEARQTADDVALGMTLGVVEMLLGGVTSFVDMYYFENRCVETVERLGIRAMLGCNYFDSNVDEVMPQVEEAVRLAAGCDRVQIALAPHSPYTVSPENLLRGKRLADKYGLHLMIHISETQDEVRIVREKYGKTSVEHLDGLGLLGPKTIGAHCIHVTDSDIETLAARGVAVSHNPQSNMKISSGVAPVEQMRAAGALVTVGTDGTCSNNDLDMFEEVRTAAFLQKSATGDPVALPAWEALRLATANGARAMGYAEGDGQLDYVQREVYAGSERIEQFTDRSNGGYERTLYVHEDMQGNTRYYTKTNGNSFAELTYDAWGMPVSPNKLLNNDHGNYVYATYTGHIFDTTLDVYFAEARFYDAQTRTWLAMDPIKDGGNWYQYCFSNPLRYWDPMGQADISLFST